MLRLTEIRLPLDHDEADLRTAITTRLDMPAKALISYTIFRRGVDARKSHAIVFIYTLDLEVVDEAPVALIGKRVELLYHGSEPEKVEIKYQDKSFGMIRMVDLNVNCRVKRDKNNNPQIQSNNLIKYQGGKLLSQKGDDHE